MIKTYQDYLDTLGFRESSSIAGGVQNYHIENPHGFIGKYQFGEAALFDLGYYGIDGSDTNLFKNDWSGNWSGKNGIHSKQDYFDNGPVQEIIIEDWHNVLWSRITALGLDQYDGQVLNGTLITASGMLAASHLIGAGSQSSDTAGLKGYLLSGAVFSPKDGNGTSANDYMNLFADFQTPFVIDHNQDGIIVGGAGQDVLTGFGGNDLLNGNEAIDTAQYQGNLADYQIEKRIDDTWLVAHQTDGMDTLTHIERLKFADTSLALDLDGNAAITAKTIGAVFGQEALSNKTLAGIGLHLLDNGTDYESLMQLAINEALGRHATNHAVVVNHLYENVVGSPPAFAEAAHFIELLDSGVYSVASIGVLAAETMLNQANIDLVGVSQTGLEYLIVST